MKNTPHETADRFTLILTDLLNDQTGDSGSAPAAENAMDGDSLTQLKLILALEAEFGIRFSLSEMTSLRSPEDFIASINRHIE
jgi:acyl carrier protein